MKINLLLILCISIFIASCQSKDKVSSDTDSEDTTTLKSEKQDPIKTDTFICDYMGEKPPGNIPLKFAADIISTKKDDSCFERWANNIF